MSNKSCKCGCGSETETALDNEFVKKETCACKSGHSESHSHDNAFVILSDQDYISNEGHSGCKCGGKC